MKFSKFTLTIDMDGTAFPTDTEVATELIAIGEDILRSSHDLTSQTQSIQDGSGSRVGSYKFHRSI